MTTDNDRESFITRLTTTTGRLMQGTGYHSDTTIVHVDNCPYCGGYHKHALNLMEKMPIQRAADCGKGEYIIEEKKEQPNVGTA